MCVDNLTNGVYMKTMMSRLTDVARPWGRRQVCAKQGGVCVRSPVFRKALCAPCSGGCFAWRANPTGCLLRVLMRWFTKKEVFDTQNEALQPYEPEPITKTSTRKSTEAILDVPRWRCDRQHQDGADKGRTLPRRDGDGQRGRLERERTNHARR